MARTLTNSEKRLALMFVGVIFLVANLLGITALWHRRADYQAQILDLSNQNMEAQSWLTEKEMWNQRKAWLDQRQPVLKSASEANAEMLDTLTAGAARHAITIIEQGFAEPDKANKSDYQEIAVKLRISGAKEAVTQWLWEIQDPAKFQAIPSLTMKLDTDPTKLDCDLTVARYYAPER